MWATAHMLRRAGLRAKLSREMAMTVCGACLGSGKVTCPACRGQRHTARLTASGDMDLSPCLVCYATGQVKCDVCAGSGNVGLSEPSGSPPATRQRAAHEDPLTGRWQATDNSWYEFHRTDAGYRVFAGNSSGPTGEGTATLSDREVHMEVAFPIIGKLRFKFELCDDRLSGSVRVFGMHIPMEFRPV